MEIKVSISARVIIQDGNVNVNEILHEAGKFGDLLKKVMAEKIIEHYQEAVVSRMCDGEEGFAVEHARRGVEDESCEEKNYIRQGWRKNPRGVRADFGDIVFKVRNVRCRGCGRIFAPIIRVLGIRSRERKADGLQLKIADMISKQSYGYGVGNLRDISGVRIPKSTAHRWIVSEDWKDLELSDGGEEIVSVLADGTGYKKQKEGGGKGDLRYVVGLTEKGEKRILGVWGNKDWKSISEDIEKRSRFAGKERPGMLISDGEPGIEENLGKMAKLHQRCLWHEKRDLGYALWRDGIVGKEREIQVDKLSGIIGIELPKEEYELVKEEDKERIKERLSSCRREFDELIREFKEKGYEKAATYLMNSVNHIFSYVELWLDVGVTSPKTTSLLESIIWQVGRRTKRIGATWSDKGIEKVVKIFLKKTYEPFNWEQYWKERMGIKNGCRIDLLSVDLKTINLN